MSERWYKEAVVYSLEVETFQDSDGDGYGDLQGLIGRLDYLARLGVTCLWLNPIHPTPNRDAGYDVSDYYGVDQRLGTLGDFAELPKQADQRGIRILLDLGICRIDHIPPRMRAHRSNATAPGSALASVSIGWVWVLPHAISARLHIWLLATAANHLHAYPYGIDDAHEERCEDSPQHLLLSRHPGRPVLPVLS